MQHKRPIRWRRVVAPSAFVAAALAVTVAGSLTWASASDRPRKHHRPAAASASASPVASAPASATPSASVSASPAGYVLAPEPVTGVKPSNLVPEPRMFHEFQAICAVSRTNLSDDPIVFPKLPGASHSHTFMGNTTTNADTTPSSLEAGATKCLAKGDLSAYWMPTLYNGDEAVNPEGVQTIYYKTGVNDYTSVRPFPKGLRFVVGNAKNTDPQKFLKATVEGFECGESYKNADIPATCPATASTKLNIRYQAPSCWDGIHLDTPDHQSHMAYPIIKDHPIGAACPDDHPVALPMLEFKMAWPVNGDMTKVRFASGRGYTFHYDFMNAWDPATLSALVKACINTGRQCNARGYDEREPITTAVLNEKYTLP